MVRGIKIKKTQGCVVLETMLMHNDLNMSSVSQKSQRKSVEGNESKGCVCARLWRPAQKKVRFLIQNVFLREHTASLLQLER